jgi:hypothetical protein
MGVFSFDIDIANMCCPKIQIRKPTWPVMKKINNRSMPVQS